MMFTNAIGISTLIVVASAAALTPPFGFEGYAVAPATFSGNIDGQGYAINGTIEEVDAKLHEMFPGKNITSEVDSHDELESRALQKRSMILPPLCIPVRGQPWARAYKSYIQRGVSQLRQRRDAGTSVDGRTCSRLSCNRDGAIWMCNDNPGSVTHRSAWLGDYANRLSDDCHQHPLFDMPNTGGQLFMTEGFNLIARHDRYC